MAIIIASAVQLFRKRDWTSKTKIFFSFFEKLGGGAKSKKLEENFSVLKRKFLKNLRAKAERNETLSQMFSSKKVRASASNETAATRKR
ncbi:hypothetical protein A2480_04775 [Candidatus Uhrbacteria bacterium RIFOXYC2_FULL_47_19]|uniref:Uncharacterized protein n=1 Tax=Candidatus Uhrbacteria bacterium RIFOXYC2_FULL_47_19 TaxID=1802424 RepID=A0A1F7WEU0_9BACT|nr:MAG: hypothetical protein A2480_04775 [Candidatus Uhrbacteria bacterium RIFOXYC2_FULL_47_19]